MTSHSIYQKLLPWGGAKLDFSVLGPHFAVMGSTGSGKTLTLRMLMRAALLTYSGSLTSRALVFDPKLEFYPILRAMGIPEDRIKVLNPFDARSVAWNLDDDIKDAAAARQLASVLVPPDQDSTQPFFSCAAHDIVATLIDVFRRHAAGTRWGLNDVLEAASELQNLYEVLALTEDGRRIYNMYLAVPNDTAVGVLATLRTKVVAYQTVARLWGRSSLKGADFSFNEWLDAPEPSIVLLGTDDTNEDVLGPLNRALFQRLAQLVTGRPGSGPHKTVWFFLDEVRLAGRLEGLQALLLKGRSKGAHIAIGLQDIQGLRDVYGEFQADEILGQCANFGVLRLSNPASMAWAADYFGKFEEYVPSYGESVTVAGWERTHTSSWNSSLMERQALLAQEFRNYPLASKEFGISGAFAATHHFWRAAAIPGSGPLTKSFIGEYLCGDGNAADGFHCRDTAEQEPLLFKASVAARLWPRGAPTWTKSFEVPQQGSGPHATLQQ